jgi:aspartate aminotransferase
MKHILSEKLNAVRPSLTLAITGKEKEMRSKGIDVIGFGAGEPDFDTPGNIKRAAIKSINSGFTKYTHVGGTPELKRAVQAKFKRENGLDYSLGHIIISCGAKHCLYNLFQAILNRGDEVIIPAPYWVSYPDMVLLADGKPVILPTREEHNFEIEIKELEKSITKRTKALILNSPSNPTGCVYSPMKLKELADFMSERDIYVISDEIYEHLVYDEAKAVSIASLSEEMKEKTIVVNGVSKAYSMTGWRIGYAAGPEEIIKAMDIIQSQSTSNPTSISQAAAVEALNGGQHMLASMVKEFRERRDYMVDALNRIPGIACKKPAGAFYVFPRISSLYGKKYQGLAINNSLDFSSVLLEKARVAVIPGAGFGDDRHVRLSYACSMDNIRKGVERIKEFAENLS